MPLSNSGIAPVSFRPDSILPFQMGLPALDVFPRKIWARLGARCVRAMQPSDMVHPPVYGLPALRAEIARYLQVSRGVNCSPSQIFVTSGYRHTIELIGHALLKVGDRVWLENPGYPPTREIFNHMHIEGVSVPVDDPLVPGSDPPVSGTAPVSLVSLVIWTAVVNVPASS
jgi:GntR family transcriptional regulator/MocR family aminotransferase